MLMCELYRLNYRYRKYSLVFSFDLLGSQATSCNVAKPT